MLTHSADPSPITEIPGWALESATGVVVGIVLGLLLVPGRWIAQYSRNRRQNNLAAFREARRQLREVQLILRFEEPDPFDSEAVRTETTETARERKGRMRRGWDEAEAALDLVQGRTIPDFVTTLADLFHRSWAVDDAYGRQAEENPNTQIVSTAIDALTHRIKHRWKPLTDYQPQITQWKSTISDADQVAADIWEKQKESYRLWLLEEDTAQGTSG